MTDSLVALIQSLEHDAKVNGPTLNIVPTCERFVFDACTYSDCYLAVGTNLPVIEMTYGTSMGLVSTRDPAGVILSKKVFNFPPASQLILLTV